METQLGDMAKTFSYHLTSKNYHDKCHILIPWTFKDWYLLLSEGCGFKLSWNILLSDCFLLLLILLLSVCGHQTSRCITAIYFVGAPFLEQVAASCLSFSFAITFKWCCIILLSVFGCFVFLFISVLFVNIKLLFMKQMTMRTTSSLCLHNA